MGLDGRYRRKDELGNGACWKSKFPGYFMSSASDNCFSDHTSRLQGTLDAASQELFQQKGAHLSGVEEMGERRQGKTERGVEAKKAPQEASRQKQNL